MVFTLADSPSRFETLAGLLDVSCASVGIDPPRCATTFAFTVLKAKTPMTVEVKADNDTVKIESLTAKNCAEVTITRPSADRVQIEIDGMVIVVQAVGISQAITKLRLVQLPEVKT